MLQLVSGAEAAAHRTGYLHVLLHSETIRSDSQKCDAKLTESAVSYQDNCG